VTITTPEGSSADELRSLRVWLHNEDGLRGVVAPVERIRTPGQLGPALEMLVASLTPGIATGFSAGIMYWIRHRSSDIDVMLTKSDGTSIKISAKRIRKLDSNGLRAEIEQLRQTLES
jgi:hypothetical protein